MLTTLTGDVGLRVLLAMMAAVALGYDRRVESHPAGMRTTLLVALAACFAMIQANWLINTVGKQPTPVRMPSGRRMRSRTMNEVSASAADSFGSGAEARCWAMGSCMERSGASRGAALLPAALESPGRSRLPPAIVSLAEREGVLEWEWKD
jgi:MgtC family